ncbi:MAG: acyl carrier protein [Candidatus Acidiferrum sp.]
MSTGTLAKDRIRSFVLENFPLARARGVKDGDELLESGIVDSLGILDLVAFLESEFALHIQDDDLMPENFRSIESIVKFTEQKSHSA